MQPAAGRPVCVLSVGRSGTSLATRALGLLGLDLGAEDAMLAANEFNRTGFWELEAMNDLNDELLAALGGSLWDPPDPAPGWEDAPEIEPFRVRAAALLDEAFPRGARIAFKDTRTVHTLALWRKVAGPMDYLLCVRNPVEVVDSLEPQLPDRTRGELFAVWLRATARALRCTEGQRRLVLPYEDWFLDPLAVARRLAAFVYGSPDALTDEAAAGILDFFDAGLRTRTGGTASLTADDVPAEVGAQHFLLRALARAEAEGSEDAAALQAVAARLEWGLRLGELAAAQRRAEVAERVHAARLAELERERDALAADRTWLRGHAEAIQLAHDEQAARASALQVEVDQARATEADARRLRESMQVLLASRSWRATRPLRAASLRLRRDRSP
jgi:hypothetical protein